MMVALLVAGIGFILAGLLGIVLGIPVKEFSFGNTLILAGVVGACTGMLMLAFWMVARELKQIAQLLSSGAAVPARAGNLPRPAAGPRDRGPENDAFPFGREPAMVDGAADHVEPAGSAAPPPWQEEAVARDRGHGDPPPTSEPEAAPAVKPRRNLMFSSSSRKERERAETRPFDSPGADPRTAPIALPPPAKPAEAPPASFDDAWPQSDRARAPDAPPPAAPRRSRTPSTFTETGTAGPERHPLPARKEEGPPVTILKSGVVDGMAYSLYSDGSIEAQMPEGMMRFASIDELRAHLDQRS
jgi:hypothetical protein